MARWAPGFLCRYCRNSAEGAPGGPQASSSYRSMPVRVSYGRATCAATSRNMSGTSSASPQPSLARKCTAWHGSGRCSAQLSTPYPCRAALLQHPRPPLQGAAAGAHLVVL